MGIFEELLKCTSYKAIYLHESQSAYIWRDGSCKYYQYLAPDQVEKLRYFAENAHKKFIIPDKAFGFSS